MIKRSTSKALGSHSFYSNAESKSLKSAQLLYESEFMLRFTSDALEFYRQVYDLKALHKAEVLGHENNQNRRYTVIQSLNIEAYLIQVETIHLSYQIWKRYSDFANWFEQVKNFVDPQTRAIFPPKKIINRMDPDFIEQRQQQLNDFILSFISNPQPQLVSFSFLDFIEVRRQYIIHQIKFTGPQGSFSSFSNVKKTNPDEEQIIEFIEQLNAGLENLTSIFNSILDFFLKQKPRLTNESINSLFLGCKQYSDGLVSVIGTLANNDSSSHFICSVGLKLMASLFDYEINRDAETFIRVFTSLPVKVISQLKLSHHIQPENHKMCKNYALRILELYLVKNNLRKSDQIMYILQEKMSSLEEFNSWYQQKHREKFILQENLPERYDRYGA